MNDITNQFDPADIEKNKTIAGLSYLGILFFLPLVSAPDSRFGKFHANQSLLIMLLGIAGGIIFAILVGIATAAFSWTFLGIVGVLSTIFNVALAALFIMGLVFAFSGKAKKLPLIGEITIIKY